MKMFLIVACFFTLVSAAPSTCPAEPAPGSCFDTDACVNGHVVSDTFKSCKESESGTDKDVFSCALREFLNGKTTPRAARNVLRKIAIDEVVQRMMVNHVADCEGEADIVKCIIDLMKEHCKDVDGSAHTGAEVGKPTQSSGIGENGSTPKSNGDEGDSGVTNAPDGKEGEGPTEASD